MSYFSPSDLWWRITRAAALAFLLISVSTERSNGQAESFVDLYGAVGDGVTWDHNAIQNAVNAAGDGGTVIFTSGKVYVACKSISLRAGQHIIGNGATLRRCDRVNTTLLALASTGDAVLTVADASRYELGMWVAPISGPNHDDGEYYSKDKRNVQSISGQEIRISQGLRQSYAEGSTVITIDDMVLSPGGGITIEGLIFDGNRRNNNDWIAWENGVSLLIQGEENVVRNNIFLDCWATCIDHYHGTAEITGNHFDGAGGSAVHLSSVDSLFFSGNQIANTNKLAVEAQHSEAAITWSLYNKGVEVSDNCVYNSGAGAFGVINRKTNNDIIIKENYVCEAKWFFSMFSAALPYEEFSYDGHVLVRDNVAVNAGVSRTSFVKDAADSLRWMYNFEFTGNTIVNGYVTFEGFSGGVVKDNIINMLDESTYGDNSTLDPARRSGMISLTKSRGINIEGNRVIGGSKGIYLRNISGFVLDDVKVLSNEVSGSLNHGIVSGDLDWLTADGSNSWKADQSGVLLDGNIVVSDAMSLASDAGMVTGRGVVSQNNCVATNAIGARIAGTRESNASGTPSTWHHGNTYVGTVAGIQAVSATAVADISLEDNTTNLPIPAEFESATGSELDGNQIDAAAMCTLTPVSAVPECMPCELMMPGTDGLSLSLKVLLEGSYVDSGRMAVSDMFRTALRDNAVYQPYGRPEFYGKPMSYFGSEFAYPEIPNGSIDWIVVTLRTGASQSSEVARQAAILTEDGTVVSPTGTPSLFFPDLAPGSYFVLVYHRNHLPVMSSEPVDMHDGDGEWDFTTSMANAYGMTPMKSLSAGYFGLFSGDANADGQITALDFTIWIAATTAGQTGYVLGDSNMDGIVTALDFKLWIANTTAGAASQIPD